MSAICGFYRRDGAPVGDAGIQAMVAALSHWSPDATGTWTGPSIGLGHAHLRVTPESGSDDRQPWVAPDGQLVVAADARIDNRLELLDAIGNPEWGLGELSDAALIAAAYRKWGADCAAHLVGDFAFAVWDAREERLVCARDIIGVRPFYYAIRDDRFAFATEIKGLFAHPGADVPREVSERVLAGMLLGAYLDPYASVRQHVKALPAAHVLSVTRDRVRLHRYWHPEHLPAVTFRRDDDYVEAYAELLERAVASRVPASGPVATTLAGIDSSSITSIARREAGARGQRIFALSWSREGRPTQREAESFLKAAPIDHRYVHFSLGSVFEPPPSLFRFHDGPIRDRRFATLIPVFEAASSQGARVLLFGLGGDEVATSHAPDYLLHLLFRGRVAGLASEIRLQSKDTGASIAGIIRNQILTPLAGSTLAGPRLSCDQLFRCASPGATAGRPAFMRQALPVPGAPHIPWGMTLTNPVRATQIALTLGGVFQYQMETRYSASALFRLECRFPMLDRRLLEFSLAVPADQHRFAGQGRRLVRRAMQHRLPQDLINGSKGTGGVVDWTAYDRQAPLVRAGIRRWRESREIAARLDLDRMESLLEQSLQGRRAAVPHLDRAFLLAAFLESETLGWN